MPAVRKAVKPEINLRDELLFAIDPFLDKSLVCPDIIEFTMSDKYCARPMLYPIQGTILKIAFLQDELFTPYDYQVIEYFSEMFAAT